MTKREYLYEMLISLRSLFDKYPLDVTTLNTYVDGLEGYSEATLKEVFLLASKAEEWPMLGALVRQANISARRVIEHEKALNAPKEEPWKSNSAAVKSMMWLYYVYGADWFNSVGSPILGKAFKKSFPEKEFNSGTFEDMKKIYPREEILQWMELQKMK